MLLPKAIDLLYCCCKLLAIGFREQCFANSENVSDKDASYVTLFPPCQLHAHVDS